MYVSAISTRFSRGMSIPAIRAIWLPLPLLVLGIGADDHHGSVATNHLAVVAAGLDGGSDFQRILELSVSLTLNVLLEAIGDAAPGQVVRGELHADLVAGQDPDEVHPKLAADMCEDTVAVL